MDHRGRRHGAPPLGAVSPGDGAVGVTAVGGRWRIHHRRGSAAAFHRRPWPERADRPTAWVLAVTEPALVLGSTQPDDVVDRHAASAGGVQIVRRQSGGGAVLLRPGEVVWVDLLVPAGDPLWDADVSRAFHWVGQVWVEALADVGFAGARPHAGALVSSAWSSLVCFAGLGPGEVATEDGRKMVGISQRRRRPGALFQCAALLQWDPAPLLDVLALEQAARQRGREELLGAAAGVGLPAEQLERAFLDRLALR